MPIVSDRFFRELARNAKHIARGRVVAVGIGSKHGEHNVSGSSALVVDPRLAPIVALDGLGAGLEKRLGLDGKKQAGPNVPTKLWRLQGKPGIDRAALSRASGSPRSLMGSNSSTNFPIVNEERFQTPQAECRKPARCSCKDEDDRRIVAVAICSNVGHH